MNRKLLALLFVSMTIFYSCSKTQPIEENPFEISVSEPIITEDFQQILSDEGVIEYTDVLEKRLSLQVNIENPREYTLKDVYYTWSFNDEAKPFIASQVISYTEDNRFTVTSFAESEKHNNPNVLPPVTGFLQNINTVLTSEQDLNDFYYKTQDDIKSQLNEITVSIYWKGGSQTKTLPIAWN